MAAASGDRARTTRTITRASAVIGSAAVVSALIAAPAFASVPPSTVLGVNGNSSVIGGDGRWMAFSTTAKLVASDTNGRRDVYLKDLSAGTVRIVSDPDGSAGVRQANGESDPLAPYDSSIGISVDGQYVVFGSRASNLVAHDANGKIDVFRWNRANGAIELVSAKVGLPTTSSNGNSQHPKVSGDGRYVSFQSFASNLVAPQPAGAMNGPQILVRDMVTKKSKYASLAPGGVFPNGGSKHADISADGKWVAFDSEASNVVAGDANGVADVFRRGLVSNAITVVSKAANGAASAALSTRPSISGTGRYVAFESDGQLVPADNNVSGDVYVRDLVAVLPAALTALVSYNGGGGVDGLGVEANFAAISADGSRVAWCYDDTGFMFPMAFYSTWALGTREGTARSLERLSLSGNGKVVGGTEWENSDKTTAVRFSASTGNPRPAVAFIPGFAIVTDSTSGVAKVTVNGVVKRVGGGGKVAIVAGQSIKVWNGSGRTKSAVA